MGDFVFKSLILSLFQILSNLIVGYHSIRISQFESILDVDDFASFPHLLVQDSFNCQFESVI